MVGAATGAIIASFLARGIGRKKSLIIGAALFIIGCIGSGMSGSADMLIGFRLILGLAVGIASYTAPLYLAEMSDKDARGKVISAISSWSLSASSLPSSRIRLSVTVVTGV